MTVPAGDALEIAASLDDPARFTAIFDRHFDAVHAFIARRAGREVADDVAAETLCVAFERRASFDLGRDDARPWLYGIAGRLIQRHWRTADRRGRAYRRIEAALLPPSHPESSAVVEAEEALGAVAAALDALPSIDRETLLLFAWEHLTYDEIARTLEIPVGTVRSRIARARGHLRHQLGLTERPVSTISPEGPST